jgi:hypothetical protein
MLLISHTLGYARITYIYMHSCQNLHSLFFPFSSFIFRNPLISTSWVEMAHLPLNTASTTRFNRSISQSSVALHVNLGNIYAAKNISSIQSNNWRSLLNNRFRSPVQYWDIFRLPQAICLLSLGYLRHQSWGRPGGSSAPARPSTNLCGFGGRCLSYLITN